MKKVLFLAVAFFAIQYVSAQETTKGPNEIFNTAGIDVKPEYPGGIQKFYKFIGDNFKSPASKDFLGGKVYVSFVIEKDGSVADIRVIRDAGFDTGIEATRVMKMCPKWIPGEQNGKKVRVLYTLPIALPPYVFDFREVDVKPNYEGGLGEVLKIVAKKFNYPSAKEFKGGEVQMIFIVEIDGSLSSFEIHKDLGFGTGEEAIRVLSGIKNWIPAKKDGKNVRCRFGIPIRLSGN